MIKEKDLVNNINSYLGNNEYYFGNEIRMGIGIPDVMIGLSLTPGNTYFNNYYLIKVLDHIMVNEVTNVENLFEVIKMPKNKLKQILKELYTLDAIDLKDDKININKKIHLRESGINISIEVKIRDWKSGLIQAQRYLKFSDYSYLALKSDYVKNIDINLAKDHGIGLISLYENELVEILEPRKSNSCDFIFKNISLAQLKPSKSFNKKIKSFLSVQ